MQIKQRYDIYLYSLGFIVQLLVTLSRLSE